MRSSLLPNLKNFFSDLERKKYSEETVYHYKRDLMVLENFLKENGVSFTEITQDSINGFKLYLASKDRITSRGNRASKTLSTTSINRHLSSIRCYLQYLRGLGVNPPLSIDAIGLEKIKTSRPFPSYTSQDLITIVEAPSRLEKNKLIALRNRAMLETIYATGIRLSELLSIKRKDVRGNTKIFIRGKNNYGRFVYLTPRAQKIVEEYLKTRNDTLPHLFIPYRGKNARDKNKKISPNYLEEKTKRYRELLGINVPVSPHSLRHAFATYLAEKGANPAAIQILLGHESLETTTRYVQASDRYAEKIHRTYHPLKK